MDTSLVRAPGVYDMQNISLLAPCGNPGVSLNGKMQENGFRHRSLVTFACDDNYQLVGNKRIICNDGFWSGSVPDCVGEL